MPATQAVGTHFLNLVVGRATDFNVGVATCATVVPSHFSSKERLARVLTNLGKPKAGAFLRGKLPSLPNIRSGDLGEILATEYVNAHLPYNVPLNRLRWKDHRNMAMRGDDIIGLRIGENGKLLLLKGEAKSRASLTTNVVSEARANLDKDGGLPSAHALSFISDRLHEAGNTALADAIDHAQLVVGINAVDVEHLTFVFTGNPPANFLRTSLTGYKGTIRQVAVGFTIAAHQQFIGQVYGAVIQNSLQA